MPAFWAAIFLAGATAPTAAAAPPGFPDLDAFSAVDPAPYVQHGLKASRIGFTTPTLTCTWDYRPDHNDHVVPGCSGTIVGLPVNSRLGYKTTIPWATRISIDGIYLHQLNATVWAQGKQNTSHGCLNLNGENAEWFYNFSVPGDIVEIRNTGGDPLKPTNNGDWSVPWSEWVKGSALR